MRGKSNEKIDNDVPGPGDYNADPNLIKDKLIGFKIDSGTKRPEIVSKETLSIPGPGVYDSPSKLGNGPSYRIGEKHKDN
jgi:hypothetical protein